MQDTLHTVCPHCEAVNRLPRARLVDGAKCGKCHKVLFSGKAVPVGESAFDQHLSRSDIPLLVDFWAPWCGPCHMMAPAFEEAARRMEPRVRLLKLNTEEAGSVASRYGIRSIPTLILFSGGREVARVSGAMDPNGLVSWTQSHLPGI